MRKKYFKFSGKSSDLEKANSLGIARRTIWYMLRFAIIATVVTALCYAVFMEAMYISNLYIIVTEGMALRADCILNDGSVSELSEHFSKLWLESDDELYSGKYDAYHVSTYNYEINIEKFDVYPWSKEAEITVVESVSQIHASAYDESNTNPIPEWNNARYEITVEKFDGRWIITNIELIERNPEPEPANTPDYSQLDESPK